MAFAKEYREEYKDDKKLPCLSCTDEQIEICSHVEDENINCKRFNLYCGVHYSAKKCGPLYRGVKYVQKYEGKIVNIKKSLKLKLEVANATWSK